MVTRVTLSADHLVTIILLRQNAKRRLNDTSSKTKDQMESGLLLDVVVRKRTAIFKLLTSED